MYYACGMSCSSCAFAGLIKSDRAAQAKALCESTCAPADSELPDPEHLTLHHMETDEATDAGLNE